jgi:Domain of unknown function (DUF4276)
MIRLAVSVEGATERTFVNTLLRQHLSSFGIAATAIELGGNVSLDRIRNHLKPLIHNFEFVSTCYDFYGFKKRGDRTIGELESEIAGLVDEENRHRLIPYVQQFEFEALMFSSVDAFREWMEASETQCRELQQILTDCGSPEQIDDGPQTSPSHRLRALFPKYDKTLHGPEILEWTGLKVVRSFCPRFNDWITRIESLTPRTDTPT